MAKIEIKSVTITAFGEIFSIMRFKHYYLIYIKGHLSQNFPTAVSYNRFVELMPRVFFHLMLFMKLIAFGRCNGISFVDSTMIPIRHNLRRHANMKNKLMPMWDN